MEKNEMSIDYKFNEGEILQQLKEYVDSTYSGHYAKGRMGTQVSECAIDDGHGIGFFSVSMQKYIRRYGKKDGRNRLDIMKALHYGLLMLYTHDVETAELQTTDTNDPQFPEASMDFLSGLEDTEIDPKNPPCPFYGTTKEYGKIFHSEINRNLKENAK